MSARRVKARELRARTDSSIFTFESTAELPELEHIIGQERAVRAIDFGVDMPGHEYHIVAVGPPGSGRTSVVRRFLEDRACTRSVPDEWCYIHNFQDPRRPRALSAPAGRATALRKGMDDLVTQLREEIPRALEGEFFEQRRREIMLELQQRQQELIQNLEQYLNERGFALMRSQYGLHIAPMVEGRALAQEEFDKLDPETRRRLESFRPELQEQFDRTMRQTRELDRERRQALDRVRNELLGFVVDQLLSDLRAQFEDCPKILEYLSAVRDDVVESADDFMPQQQQQMPIPMPVARNETWANRYKVNVLSETSDSGCAPIVREDNPTYQNLVGRIEHRAEFGAVVTDFTQIRAGALHRANGGYLLVEARNLFSQPAAWVGLRRALRNREIKIEEIAQYYGLMSTSTLEPEPIPLDVKVVIISDQWVYQVLSIYDEDFNTLFKVKAEFATTMPREEQAAQDYACFIGDLSRTEGLLHFDPGAVARVIDEGSRLAEDRNKLATRMAEVGDLVRQSAFWANRAGHSMVTSEDVSRAVGERIYRLGYTAEQFVQRIDEGVILIDTDGQSIGQVNGLSVIQMPNFQFGIPSRVTARTFLGRSGVVSIDREVKLSGPIHNKGQLILSAWLANHFAQKHPLSISATLTFEQNYAGVEGDSASSTELYALLSSLSGIPIKQSYAVTGSVNQAGQIQAIGGVNSKIEGYFDVCKVRGLTGDQGVLIPASNVRHLMVREDVVAAAEQGRFGIYAVERVEEGIELLTGVPAGVADADGNYPPDTVFGKVQARLEEYARRQREEAEQRYRSAGSLSRGEDDEDEDAPPQLGEPPPVPPEPGDGQ